MLLVVGRTNSTEKKIAIREAQIEKLKEELDRLKRGATPKTAADLNAENRLLYEGDYDGLGQGLSKRKPMPGHVTLRERRENAAAGASGHGAADTYTHQRLTMCTTGTYSTV